MTPEKELAVIRSDAIRYKGVSVDLPEPVAKYIEYLIAERYSALQMEDAMHSRLIATMTGPTA